MIYSHSGLARGLSRTDDCCQAWDPELAVWVPHCGWRELTPSRCLLTSTYTPRHMWNYTHTHTHTHVNVIKKKFLITVGDSTISLPTIHKNCKYEISKDQWSQTIPHANMVWLAFAVSCPIPAQEMILLITCGKSMQMAHIMDQSNVKQVEKHLK